MPPPPQTKILRSAPADNWENLSPFYCSYSMSVALKPTYSKMGTHTSHTKYCYSHISVCMICTCPEYLRDLLDCYKANRETPVCWQVGKLLLGEPVVRSSIEERAFSCAAPTKEFENFKLLAPTLWNALPLRVRACTSLVHFKVSLITHLFMEHFN